MTPFYTRTGDEGFTGLLGEGRVRKDHARIEALGSVDEASAALGLARATCQAAETAPLLLTIQRDLYALMAEIAATPENAHKFHTIDEARVNWLEAATDNISAIVVLPKEFILPGDTPGGAALALARTVVRRAERRVVELFLDGELENGEIVRYLNRLSSLVFTLELLENKNVSQKTTFAKDA